MITPLAELVTGLEKRRQSNDKGQLRLVKDVFHLGIGATKIVCPQSADVSLLFRWHRQLFDPHR